MSYSPLFSLDFVIKKVERVVSVGYVSWWFKVRCRVWHSKGQFTYEAADLFIPLECFQRFHSELRNMGQGDAHEATLVDTGRCSRGRRLQSAIKIHEYQAGDELTTLSAGFEVDYDLFANKLRDDLGEFIGRLRLVIPENV